jgi:hypothetical protein
MNWLRLAWAVVLIAGIGLSPYASLAGIPAVGPWHVGIYDNTTGQFWLRYALSTGNANKSVLFGPGGPNYVALTGDWDGDGKPGVGVYDKTAGQFWLRNDLDGEPATISFQYGPLPVDEGLIPIVGNWDGVGGDGIGLYDPVWGNFWLRDDASAGPRETRA